MPTLSGELHQTGEDKLHGEDSEAVVVCDGGRLRGGGQELLGRVSVKKRA